MVKYMDSKSSNNKYTCKLFSSQVYLWYKLSSWNKQELINTMVLYLCVVCSFF